MLWMSSGKYFIFLLYLFRQVSDLKNKIQDSKADLLAERQKLIHSGKVLKDEQSISELGITESDFIVCMITKEVAKVRSKFMHPNIFYFAHASLSLQKATPVPAPAAPVSTESLPAPALATPAPTLPTIPAAPIAAAQPAAQQDESTQQFVTAEGLAALVGMGFPESESRAALNAAMGNADLAYEFLLTGIPERARAPPVNRTLVPGSPAAAPAGGGIEQLRRHPQFNMLKQLVQQNPASLPQVLDLIGQQDPALLATIHANNEAFIAMMNEPIVEAPPAQQQAPAAAANPMADPTQMVQMLAQMQPAQRAQFAQTLGMTPAQLEGFMQMMSSIPPEQLQQMLAGAGGMGGAGEQDAANVIRLTAEEMEAVNRLMALGFSQQEAAQAYLACDKNEAVAANLLLEGGWADDDEGYGGHEDDMYH